MTDKVYVHAVATNQKTSSFRFELTRQTLSELLGWRADGEGVEEVDALLHDGVGVEVFTRQVPTEAGTDGVAYRFLPFTGELAEGQLPVVTSVVDVRRRD